MPRALPSRRLPRHHRLHRPPPGGTRMRTSDLVTALLGVVLLGGLALVAAWALTLGPAAP